MMVDHRRLLRKKEIKHQNLGTIQLIPTKTILCAIIRAIKISR
jgi:hypothetical protein